MIKCRKCKRIVRGDCMLTGRPDVENVCVFCYYKIDSWDSNGRLVTEKEATNCYYKDSKGWIAIRDGKMFRIKRNLFKRNPFEGRIQGQ